MCDQTEINYLDGDVVWVKLGACWWPGQVTGVENLPEDLKLDFKRKPPIAAVKFFQENTYEFVKNLHQIYKYNCTQKDEFIKKGLDKHRSKRKDGSSLMDKFPGDVERAEKLTGGDPEILRNEKFCPEEKPDISSLFGEKKLPKKKQRIKDGEMMRHSYGGNSPRKIITHPRFLKENDHKIRIRHQPSNSHPAVANTNDGQFYLCHLCNFTSTRVNVIISHNKSHRVGITESPISRPSCAQPKSRSLGGGGAGSGNGGSSDAQKKKYIRKNKSLPKMKNERENESLKRKHQKQVEKNNKKKKSDPEIKELLADWDDGSDDDMDVDLNKSTDATDSIDSSPTKDSRKDMNKQIEDDYDDHNNTNILIETEKLLKETENSSIHFENSIKKTLNVDTGRASDPSYDLDTKNESLSLSNKIEEAFEGERKHTNLDKDQDKKSKFSCFDFEDEEPEPAMPPVRKIPRVFGEKNTSLKKELIKEFTMSQAMANEKEIEGKEIITKQSENFNRDQNLKSIENSSAIISESKISFNEIENSNNDSDEKLSQTISQTVDEANVLVEKLSSETECSNQEKSKCDVAETELEIVEILEIEREKEMEEEKLIGEFGDEKSPLNENTEMNEKLSSAINISDHQVSLSPNYSSRKSTFSPVSSPKATETPPRQTKQSENLNTDDINSDRVTIESEVETLPISQFNKVESGGDENIVDEIGWNQLHEIIGSSEQTTAIMKDPLIMEELSLKQKSEHEEKEVYQQEEIEGEDEKKDKSGVEKKNVENQIKQQQCSQVGEKPVKRRGRPRKYPIQTEIIGNEDALMKIEDPQLPRTPDSQDMDMKTSESDCERSYTGRKRKPNKKYLSSDIYNPSPDRRTPKTDESQSETEEKPQKEHVKGKRGRKPSRLNKNIRKSVEEYECSDQTLDIAEEIAGISIIIPKSPIKISTESIDQKKKCDVISPVHITDLLSTNDIEIREIESLKSAVDTETEREMVEKSEIKLYKVNDKPIAEDIDEDDKKKVGILPPKKSQIKKFEQSQIDSSELVANESQRELEPGKSEDCFKNINEDMEASLNVIENKLETIPEMIIDGIKPLKDEEDNSGTIVEETIKNIVIEEMIEQSEKDESKILLSMVDNNKSENVDEISQFIENPHINFESDMNSKIIEKSENDLLTSDEKIVKSDVHISVDNSLKLNESAIDSCSMTKEIASLEAVLSDKPVEMDISQQSSTDSTSEIGLSVSPNSTHDELLKVHDGAAKESIITVPVKKREKPRIIENVTLKEPMQILKSKLLEKQPAKPIKHKLDNENSQNKNETAIGVSSPKLMKIESTTSNSKSKLSPVKIKTTPLSITKKLQVLKTEEALEDIETNTISIPSSTGTQNLSEMELDINSIPFVLSEDLNPDNIEQMPVIMSSIIPSVSCAMTTALPLTTSATKNQLPCSISNSSSNNSSSTTSSSGGSGSSTSHCTGGSTSTISTSIITAPNETSCSEVTPVKKKTASPAILKTNKTKAKPTITSIKTLVPPLTGGVKGLKFQSPPQQISKAMPVLTNQKCTPSKYVIVQTAGGQKVRYTVQGKSAYPQKVPISACSKTTTTSNPQIVQQGNKVVIITSPQQGQQKVVPLSVQKGIHGGKVQKIVGTKAQVFSQLNNPKSTMISSKNDINSPTTSKLSLDSQKIMNTGILSSKGILTSIAGTKTILSSIPQQLLSKGGVITQLSSSSLSGKTVIGQKAIVTNKGTFYAPISTQGGTKTILAPISQTSLTGKTLLTSHSLVSGKGPVLTPFTGQQVKAMAAKSPAKTPTTKLQYQTLQQKVQLPMLQKKITISSPASNMRISGSLKSPSGTFILQNSPTIQQQQSTKILSSGKKIVRQTGTVNATAVPTSLIPTTPVQPSKSLPTLTQHQTLQKSKTTSLSCSKIKQTKQKIIIQKMAQQTSVGEGSASSSSSSGGGGGGGGSSQKSSIPTTTAIMTSIIKTPTQSNQKATVSTALGSNRIIRGQTSANKNIQKHLLATVAQSSACSIQSSSVGILQESVQMDNEKKIDNIEGILMKSSDKITEPTISKLDSLSEDNLARIEEEKFGNQTAQPQIMALPTESADGSQTYVLVTIDDQGQIQPLDNNTLMSLEGTTPNADGSRTLYIDPSSLDPSGTLDNIVLQFDNNSVSGCSALAINNTSDSPQVGNASYQSSNQDILAAALANTDFQQDICLPETSTSTVVMSAGLTQTNLDTQTILQSTLIPSTEPISSPSVLETSLTLNQPIMTPLEVPSSVAMQLETNPASVSNIPSSLELPITMTNSSNISYISTSEVNLPETEQSEAVEEVKADNRLPGNSMPDIGEIMEPSETSMEITKSQEISSQYLVIPALDGSNIIRGQCENANLTVTSEPSGSTVSYGVSVSDNNVIIDSEKIQTTPSMPIIDDSYVDNIEFPSKLSVSQSNEGKLSDNICESGMEISDKNPNEKEVASKTNHEIQSPPPRIKQEIIRDMPAFLQEDDEEKKDKKDEEQSMQQQQKKKKKKQRKEDEELEIFDSETDDSLNEINESSTNSKAIIATCMSSEKHPCISTGSNIEVVESSANVLETNSESTEAESIGRENFERSQIETSSNPTELMQTDSKTDSDINHCIEEESKETVQSSTQPIAESIDTNYGMNNKIENETNEIEMKKIQEITQDEAPSQSYEKFEILSINTDGVISQSTSSTSDTSEEATQSITYKSMDVDGIKVNDKICTGEPPSQSFEDTERASQSCVTISQSTYENSNDNTNAPTQSFNQVIQSEEERMSPTNDDTSFPTQSYEVGKIHDNLGETLETDGEISQEGNIPSQSNDIGNDGIGTSTFSSNNTGFNEDETASSSYVPETPENQERDQDQESAISTSSYEIPPCEEINIATSSVIPDTSVNTEHTSIHDNGVPEIPTSSYNLNPDSSSSMHVDVAVPTSSYEDQIIVEQNVSTSYEDPISMPGLEENSSQNFVSESTNPRNESSSYYTTTTTEEVTSEPSQSYLVPENPSPSYTSQKASPSYYDAPPETEASQSYYSTQQTSERTDQSSNQSSGNTEPASQSFYQETSDEISLRPQGEATPTYTERYPADYTLQNSPIERHDLVESSIPATTKPAER